MIKLYYSEAFFIYLLIWLITIAILWARELWRTRDQGWSPAKSRLFSCDVCHYAFLTDENTNITRCPRCNAICIIRKRRN